MTVVEICHVLLNGFYQLLLPENAAAHHVTDVAQHGLAALHGQRRAENLFNRVHLTRHW